MLEGLKKPERPRGYCKVAAVSQTLEANDAKILNEAIDDPSWVAKQLSKALQERGVIISDTTILRHRRRECICD